MMRMQILFTTEDRMKRKIDQLITGGAKRQKKNSEHVHVLVLKRQKEKQKTMYFF